MHPSTAIHHLSLPSTTHQPKPIEVPLVQPGRVRLVMRNGYISRLLGAGEPTFEQFESDSGSDSENETSTKQRRSTPKVTERDKSARALYAIKPTSAVPTYQTFRPRIFRTRFIGPKSGDPMINQARYEEFASGVKAPFALLRNSAQIASTPTPFRTTATPGHSFSRSIPLKAVSDVSRPTISTYSGPKVVKHTEIINQVYQKPLRPSKSGALISKIKSTLEFRASGNQIKGVNIGVQPQSPSENDETKPQIAKAESKPSKISNFFHKMLRKTPKTETKDEKLSALKAPVHCQAADERVIHGFTVQKPTVVAELDSKIQKLPRSPNDSPRLRKKSSVKSVKSITSTSQKPTDPSSPNATPGMKVRKLLQKSISKERLDQPIKERGETKEVEPKPGSPKTLVQVERKDNGRFVLPELKRVTSPILKPKKPEKPESPPNCPYNAEKVLVRKQALHVKEAIEKAPLANMDEISESSEKTKSPERPLGIVRPFSRTGNPNDRNIPIGPMPNDVIQRVARPATATLGEPQNENRTPSREEPTRSTPGSRQLNNHSTLQNVKDSPMRTSETLKVSEADQLERLQELEAQLREHKNRLDELAHQPFLPQAQPAIVVEKRVMVRYDDNLVRKPSNKAKKAGLKVPPKPPKKEIPDQPQPWIVQPSPLNVDAYMQKANEQCSRWNGQIVISPHSAASLAASSTGRPLSPTSPSNLITLEERVLSPPLNKTLLRKQMPKSPRDLLNPLPKAEKPIPLWRAQNAARFGKESTKSLISRSTPKDDLLISEMAKSAPPATLLLEENKGGTGEESAVSFHTPPPEPTITVAPPTPIMKKKTLEVDTMTATKKSLKTMKDIKLASPSCIPWDSSFELAEAYSDASVMDDESQYSAITHFVPKKIKKPPVPGMWLKDGVELISKNKRFKREEESHATVSTWKIRQSDKISKDLKATPLKKLSKPGTPTTEKKKMVMKKKLITDINAKDVERAMKEREISPLGRKKDEKPIIPVEVSVSTILQNRLAAKQATAKKLLYNERISLSNQKPLKARRKPIPLALAVIDKDFHRKRMDFRVQKALKEFGKQQEKHSLKCKAATSKTTRIEQNLSRNQASGGAKVIVVSAPIDHVNISRIKHKCKTSRVKKERNSMPCYTSLEHSTSGFEEEKERIQAIQANNGAHSDTEYDNEEDGRLKRESSVAAVILDEMRGKDSTVDWSNKTGGPSIFLNNGQEPLILPDQSILEEYVKRKRGRLERLHSEPIPETDENRFECDSPCNSTASEFIPASAVRVHEPSSRGVPVITTAPQKSRSRMSSGEPQTPTAMLETQQPMNNFNSTPQAFLRRQAPRAILFQAPQSFDVPKTPFESALQQQANQIARRASINSLSTYSEPGECRSEATAQGHQRQNSQDGSISSSFTAALAANQPTRHERYAAHIPVNRGDGSGRQSVNSVDSQASGALETASKQLDQVIDQARYRHHQHRSRFKEAIDYLDQIFEDLKRECDTGAQQASAVNATTDETNNDPSQMVEIPSASSGSHTTSKEALLRRPQPAPVVVDPSPSSYATQSLPNRSTKHRPQKWGSIDDSFAFSPITPPSPIEGVSKKTGAKQQKSTDSEVAETIVLPKKPDKLDFTRKWLHDDLSSFGMSSPAPLVIGPEMTLYTDVDEHSLGSCSAEVAAINENTKTKKKEKKSSQNKTKPHADVKPVKPQALRPQPQYSTSSSGNNGPRQFPVDFEPAPPLPRVASFDHMSDKTEQNGWRSGSQEPYNNSLTLHPNDPRPSPSAFQNVSPSVQRNSLRGSIRSLPDAGRIPSFRPTPDPPRDPGLAIDALVAELELNTEESALAEKRRSFPTAIGRLNEYEQPRNRINPPTQPRRITQPINYSHGYQQPPAPSQPILPSSTYSNSNPVASRAPVIQKQPNLDEMASMLASVANEFSSTQSPAPTTQNRQHNGRRASVPRQNSGGSTSNQQSFIYAIPHMHAPPFETINKERINPSRVEAMQNVFETRPSGTEWRRGPQPYKSPSREEENYYEIGELQQSFYQPPKKESNHQPMIDKPRQAYKNPSNHYSTSHDFYPQYPASQPPTMPPVGRNGSAGSSQNGGYYSSNSSDHHQGHAQLMRRGSLVGRQSMNSRAHSQDEEDDGFYDNIAHMDDRRLSRGSDVFETGSLNRTASTKSYTQGKIGSFFRKIGSGRPPGAAASLVSLNKAGIEPIIQPTGPLMKSSSLSQDPWNKHVLGGPSLPSPTNDKNKGIGQRLKNSLFGSKKRLNG
ncbi:unnamed protein product, partial [Mesorhabditis belari]|uniref:Uncharacterized protein n=1 Tax=Mesorhabditis belari TaxID=2138241 RepID=A0AAF3ESU8_9BILA